MNDKEVIIIIPGANYLKSGSCILQSLITNFYRLFNVIPRQEKTREEWIEKIQKDNREVLYFCWSGEPSLRETKVSVDKLVDQIKSLGEVKVISCSLGTQICLKSLSRLKNVTKVISIAGVYRKINIDLNLVDIRSNKDHFANFFKYIFNLFNFSKMKITSVVLENTRHDEFHSDFIIRVADFPVVLPQVPCRKV
jgi:hypothetical protein